MISILGSEFDDPRTQGILALGMGLLGNRSRNFGQALSGAGQQGIQAYGAAQQERRLLAAQELQKQLAQMQIQQAQMQLEQARTEAQKREAIKTLIERSARSPQQVAMAANGGPTNAALAASQTAKPEFDWGGYAEGLAGIDPTAALSVKQALKKEQPKLKSVETMRDPGTGKMVNVALFEDGTSRVLPFGVRPDIALQNLGDRTVAIDKNSTEGGQAWTMGTSPDARLSAGTQRAIAAQTDARERSLAGTRVQYVTGADGITRAMPTQLIGQPPSVLEGIPVAGGTKEQTAAVKLDPLIQEAKALVKGATGSGIGAATDFVASMFGGATAGAENIAQLKVIEGKLMMAQPRMEGPQSDKDTALYRQMAAQIGDPMVPAPVKAAALKTLERINDAYLPSGYKKDPSTPVEPVEPVAPTSPRVGRGMPPNPAGRPGTTMRFDAQGNLILGN